MPRKTFILGEKEKLDVESRVETTVYWENAMQTETNQISGHKTRHCFARRHMLAAVESFHRYALNSSRKSGIFYRSDRRDAKDFGVSKTTITKWVRFLEENKWMSRLSTGRRLKRNKTTGMYASIPYRVLDHDTWAADHPGTCRFIKAQNTDELTEETNHPVPEIGTGLSQKMTAPVPETDPTCTSFDAPPVPETGTKTEGLDGNVDRREREKEKPLSLLYNLADTSRSHRPQPEVIRLTRLVISKALDTAETAVFTVGDKRELSKEIADSDYTEQELLIHTKRIIEPLDDFNLGKAGGILCTKLGPAIDARRAYDREQREQESLMARESVRRQQEVARDIAAIEAKEQAEAAAIAADPLWKDLEEVPLAHAATATKSLSEQPMMSEQEVKRLADCVIEEALKMSDGSAIFHPKDRKEIARVIREINADEADLRYAVGSLMSTWDAFAMRRAGETLATTLGPEILRLLEESEKNQVNHAVA